MFFKLLAKQGVKPEEIRFLFLTHHHDDHSGLINDLASIDPEIRLIMHAESRITSYNVCYTKLLRI